MDFRVEVNGESEIFYQFHDALKFIESKMATWNNFHPEEVLYIRLQKVPSPGNHINIHVADEQKMGDFFGGA